MRRPLWIICASATFVVLFSPTIPRAEQLPPPPSPQERRCAIIFEGVKNSLYQARDFFYDKRGVYDRDDLANQMVGFSGPRAMVGEFQKFCPEYALGFPPAALLAMAYHIIAERFGDAR